jgi:hypothetical protein
VLTCNKIVFRCNKKLEMYAKIVYGCKKKRRIYAEQDTTGRSTIKQFRVE